MVNKMEKFTKKEYEVTKDLLNDIHTYPDSINYEINNNDALEKLYNWFNANSFEFVGLIINSDKVFDDIFYKIFTDVQNIRAKNINRENFYLKLNRLKTYYNKIESKAKDIINGDESIKKYLIDIINNILLNDSEKLEINVNEIKEKLKQYNIQADIVSEDLSLRTKESINNINKQRDDFNKILENYQKDIEKTKSALLKDYDEFKENHDNFKNKIYQDLNDIQNSVNREQLAAYFLNERKKLKGDIDIPVIIYTLLIEVIIYFTVDIFTSFWNIYGFLKTIVLLVCLFIALLLIVKNIYYKVFDKETKNDVKPFEELKGLLTPYWCWLGLTFIGMGCIAKVAYALYYVNSTKIDHLDPYLLLANLPIFMILVWFTWFSSKQFSYTKQICDEYEYKYALSKSYLSYRDEAKELAARGNNDAILVALLDSVIKNVATSPVKSVKPDCHTPFTEVFSSIRGAAKTIEDDDISRSVK